MSSRRNQVPIDDDDNYSQASEISDASDTEPDQPSQAVDPLLSAIEDLENRIVSAIDNFKLHPGIKSNPASESIHSELKEILRPVLEIAAHTGPSTARAQWRQAFRSNVDDAIEEVYRKLNAELILPELKDSAQSDLIPAKRAAALAFFHNLYTEYKSPGSYLDYAENLQGGGYVGTLYGAFDKMAVPSRYTLKQRTVQKATKNADLLRYWIEASTGCTVPGAFSDQKADGAIASRAVISASAVIRPALRYIAEKISSADDVSASKLFIPVMKMIRGVMKRFLTVQDTSSMDVGEIASLEAVKSACIKFLEIVVLCFSLRSEGGSTRRGKSSSSDDFALEDLPMGHPTITRQSLEEIGEDAFTVLRGLTLMGGQVRVESGLKSDVIMSLGLDFSGSGNSPGLEIVGIIRPAALSYLEIESTIGQNVTAENKFHVIDRNNIDLDFRLNQKSYALAINAVSMLAVNRPAFFQDSATCLARRVMDPPSSENSSLGKAACMAVRSHLRASCLTLLRNALSVTSKSADILTEALSSDECGMKIQADKALGMAKQAANLKTAGRAARNRAAIFYEWDSAKDEGDEMVELSKKRQRAGDDALEKMRAAKAARGLGSGIQLPKNMADACELILLNLSNLPSTRAAAIKGDKKSQTKSDMKRKRPFTFDYLVDVIISNGASLVSDENRWYGRDGGDAWSMEIAALVSDDEAPSASIESPPLSKAPVPVTFTLDMKMTDAAVAAVKGDTSDIANLYMDQCKAATADAFERILQRARSVKDQSVADFGNQIAARLAWSLKGVQPLHELKDDENIVNNGLSVMATKYNENTERKSKYESLQSFASEYPLVASCIQFDLESNSLQNIGNDGLETSSTASSNLAQKILNEAYMGISSGPQSDEMYRKALDLYICTILHACENADDKPMDIQRKKLASSASATLSKHLGELPSLPEDALEMASLLCDVSDITKKAKESSRKTSSQNIQTSAAINAAKAAAEKRAKMILIALRDVAFQRSRVEVRSDAVNCAIGIATGRLPSSPAVEEMALKLVMNVLYPKSPELANQVVAAASRELERVSRYAIENFDKIREANEEALAKKGEQVRISPLQPISDAEKAALEKVKKSANLFMALCIRRPDIIKTLMSSSCQEGADILAKAVRNNMSKMALAAGKKYGSNKIAQQVADMADVSETPLLLSFLDSLCPTSGAPPTPELIEAYISIQNSRLVDGQKDPRYIIPVLSGMKRSDLESQIASFVDAEDNVFKAALNRMSERLHKQMYSFREEPEQQPTLLGMTLCEQIVFLHRMDFAASNIPQKRYLDAIRICLEDDEVYTDRVIMAALDYISVTFLNGEPLPLAYMRTLILTCSKHESLHSWICNELLPRLVEGKVYNDRRQWEGWMRCAKMLESGDVGASSANAIQQLPDDIREIYRSRYPK